MQHQTITQRNICLKTRGLPTILGARVAVVFGDGGRIQWLHGEHVWHWVDITGSARAGASTTRWDKMRGGSDGAQDRSCGGDDARRVPSCGLRSQHCRAGAQLLGVAALSPELVGRWQRDWVNSGSSVIGSGRRVVCN
ncbi:hypothetical protein HN51_032686 [Arachis hypogaea]